MKTPFIIFFLVLSFLSTSAFGQDGIRFSDGSLNAILSIAKDHNKNVFIDTYADWCQPCKHMEKKFKNKDVAKFFNEHFINYRVNMQNPIKANQLRKRYDIVFLPTMLIVDPNGVIKYHVDRELTISELLNMGQKSLDPTSYHISEATSVRRNTNEIVVAQTQKPHPVNNNLPSTSIPTKEKTKPTTTYSSSLSAATKRAKLLDSYETVEESSQKILAVLGDSELPPEVLLQEAYLRLEFMDGSHILAAKNYLATQENWNTEINRKFILDFVTSASSPEYKFIVTQRQIFNRQFGEGVVKKTLEIITYRALYNAVPRPNLNESIQLYTNLGIKEPKRQGYNYYISRLIASDKLANVLLIANQYLVLESRDHEFLYLIARYLTNRSNRSEENLKFASKFMEDAIKITPKSLIYLDLLGTIYTEQGKAKRAKKTYIKAIQEAKKQGKNSKVFEDKNAALNG